MPKAAEVNYCKLYQLPMPNWQYRPFPGRYGTQRCAYCGDRAEGRIDTIPNMLYIAAGTTRGETWLVDCCAHCQAILAREPALAPTFVRRQHAILIVLRRVYNASKGPRYSKGRRELERRIQVLSGLRKPGL